LKELLVGLASPLVAIRNQSIELLIPSADPKEHCLKVKGHSADTKGISTNVKEQLTASENSSARTGGFLLGEPGPVFHLLLIFPYYSVPK
jgi:hypothetical protein